VSPARTFLPLLLLLMLVPLPAAAWAPPPSGVGWDYQLGGPRPLPEGVDVVVRDRREEPAGGYDVCYVNAFQTQPDERSFWRGSTSRWRLVLRDGGRPVTDEAWGEWLLDIRTAAKRERLARIVGRWIDRCAANGFDAVELDNLDSFSRSHRKLRASHAIRYSRLLVARAHEVDLAVAQKNWVELGERGPRIGFDFAIAEECGRWRECAGYAEAYDDHVLVVEYRRRDFTWSCEQFGERLSVVLRDYC
jgi:Glycoside-hydrolase family GH114